MPEVEPTGQCGHTYDGHQGDRNVIQCEKFISSISQNLAR